ncbi:MAG: FlgD immunoglobulin-like domain containing protein [Rhodothermales bacterium]
MNYRYNTLRTRFSTFAWTFSLLLVGLASPALAQDVGNAGFDNTASIGDGSIINTLGLTYNPVPDGVTQVSPVVANGTLFLEVETKAAGRLSVWPDTQDNATFTDNAQQIFLIPGAGTHQISVTGVGVANPAPGRWFRFIFEVGTVTVADPNTNYGAPAVAQGEIEDYQFEVLGAGGPISFTVPPGGGTTTTTLTGGTDIQVDFNGNPIFQAPLADVTSLSLTGDPAANDNFVIDLTNGDPIPAGGVAVDGGVGGTDDLTVTDNVNNDPVTHTFTGPGAGTIDVDDGTITYSNLEDVVDDVPAVTRLFNGTGNDEIIDITEGGGVGDDVILVDSDDGTPILVNVAATTDLNIDAGGGNDTINIDVLDSAFTGSNIDILGGTGNDELNVDMASDGPLATGPLSFDGGPGASDDLNLSNNSYTAVTHDFEAGTIDVGLPNIITYSNTENVDDDLTVEDRTYFFTAGADTGTIGDDGDAGDGESFISDGNTDVTFNNPTGGTPTLTVDARGGNDTLTLQAFDSAAAHATSILGGADDDDLLVDFLNGIPVAAGTVDWDGGTGTNSFLLDNGSGFMTITHDFAASTVDIDGGNDFTYLNSPVNEDDLGATNKVFNFSAGPDAVVISDDGDAADNQSRTTDGTLTMDYRRAGTTTTFNGLAGNDTFAFGLLDANVNNAVVINGGDDDDTLTVDWSAGDPLAGPNLTYNGGAGGTNSDDLILDDGPGIVTIDHVYANANDGTVTVNGNLMTYTGLEPIMDNLTGTTRTFTFPATDDDITLNVDFSLTHSQISSVASSEITTFAFGGLDTVVINGGSGSDIFDVEPTVEYAITVNGQAPTTLTPGDRFTLNTGSLGLGDKVTLVETNNTDGVYSFDSGEQDVTYTGMEIVDLRFSDPNAYLGSTYEGDWMYPLNTETGISIEPYFNWDIENWPAGPHPSSLTTLLLEVSLNSDLSAPVFTTTLKEDGVTPLIATGLNEDHFITDADRDAGIVLLNDTQYYWGLTADMLSGAVFCQTATFRTIDELQPTLNYPADGLTLHNTDIFNFSWDVAHATSHDLYWRMDLDLNDKLSFDGATPAIMGGDIENDDNTNAADGFTEVTMFSSNNLPTPILYGSTYTWRVATMWPVPPTGWVPQEIHDLDETDRMVGLSELAEFQTVVRAVVPIQSYPVDGHIVYVNDPVLSWYTGGPFNNLTFDVEVYLADGTSTPAVPVPTGPTVCSTTGLTGLQFDTDTFCGGLDPGVTYVWRVRSNLGAQQSAWSGYEEFTTQGVGTNVAVTPSYPVDGLEIYTTAPTLHWFTGTKFGGLDYTVWYLDYTGGAVPASCAALKVAPGAVSLPTVSVTQTQVTGLLPGSDYAWCVTSSNGITPDLDSVVETFHVVGGEDDAFPVASWPIGNPTTYSLTQPLTWYLNGPALGVSTYDVQYCDDSGFTTNCTTVTGLTNTQYTITGLSYGDVVHWRVRANYTGGGQSDWTNPQSQGSFTVTGLLSTLNAVLTYPVGGLILSDDQAVFNWYVNGSTLGPNAYRVQWSYTQNFINIGTVTQTQVTTDQFLAVNDLIPGHTYWWRVAVSNDGGATFGTYSAAESFVVDAGAVAVQPRVGSPVGGVRVGTLSPTISWILPVAAGEGVTYDLYLSTSPDMSNPTVFEGVANAYYRPDGLEPGMYFWQVRSSGNGVISAFSDVGVFSASAMSTGIEEPDDVIDNGNAKPTDDETAVDGDVDGVDDPKSDLDEPAQEVLPDAFMLGQNYPNPFNPTTTIQFNVAEAANVNITIYNMLGQQVRTLVSGQMAPGQYSVQWDSRDAAGRAMPSGMYLYRMDAGSFNQTRTLVLMK